jgi:hypothetical protein
MTSDRAQRNTSDGAARRAAGDRLGTLGDIGYGFRFAGSRLSDRLPL